MIGIRFLALLGAAALTSCGAPPDNPENVPLSGKWSDQGELVSVVVGGMTVDPADLPGLGQLKAKVSDSKEFCGEPRFLDKEAFQERIDENNPLKCEIQSVDGDGKSMRAKGVCQAMKLPGVDGSATLDARSRIEPEKVVYDMTIDVAVTDAATGEGETVTLQARRTMTRLGDC